VSHYHEREQDAESSCRNGKEVDCHDVPHVIVQERAP
jgi:hypothetical protein